MTKTRITLVGLVILLGLALAVPTFAQRGSVNSSGRGATSTTRENVLEERQGRRAEVKIESETRRENPGTATSTLSERLKEIRNRLEERRAEVREKFETRQEEFRERLEEKREDLQERIKEKREQLKERLERIRDERKKRIVERLDQRLDELNQRLLAHFSDVLHKLEGVLERISSRADKAAERGLDVSAVRRAITEAEEAIRASRSAIETQAGKTYNIVISTEETLRADVGAARQALHADLRRVRQTVKAAHDAVRNAATTLAKIPRVNDEPEEETESTSTSQLLP